MKLLKKVIDKIRDKFLSDEEYARRIGVKIGKHCYISTLFDKYRRLCTNST